MIALAIAFQQLLAVLDLLELPYFVGGSVASGSYGLARQTNAIDFIADFRNLELAAFCELLKRDFYVDLQSVVKPYGKAALQRHSLNERGQV